MSMGASITLSGFICLGVAAFCAVFPNIWLANDWTYWAAFAALAASAVPTLVCMRRGI